MMIIGKLRTAGAPCQCPLTPKGPSYQCVKQCIAHPVVSREAEQQWLDGVKVMAR